MAGGGPADAFYQKEISRNGPEVRFGEVTVAVANDKKPRRQDSRVPAVYLASAFVWIIPVLEFCKISNLRRINPPEGFVPTLLLAGASGIRAKTTIGRRHLLALARSRPSRSRQTQVRER